MDKYKLITSDCNSKVWSLFEDEKTQITLYYWGDLHTMTIRQATFILNEGVTWESMMAERKDLRHSAKYGHWQAQIPTITKEMVDFMHEVFNEETESEDKG